MKELANQVSSERDVLHETFDVFDEALLMLDSTGRVQIENAAARKLIERLVSGHDGGIRESIFTDLAELARDVVTRKVMCDRRFSYEGRQLEVRAYPAARRHVLVYVRDVTEKRDAEVRRLQSEKLASIGMLAAGVAHEINNPASFVLANVDALAGLLRALDEKLKGDPQIARKLGLKDLLFEAMTIVQESKEGMVRIHRIVRDLHAFTHVPDDAVMETDVNAAIESALTMLRNELRYRTVVERDLRAKQPVSASAARLGQVFLNLLVNAAHVLPEGNLKRNRLWVRSYDQGPLVVVEVQDNGPGISPDVMPRIFESFFTTKPADVGTGLGLSISREIVRAAGGELTAESEPGKGALFRAKLPALEERTPVTPRPSVVLRRRLRLLAVDDEALLLKAYRRMLIDHHDVEIALGGREALRIFEGDQDFDAVLCDLQMPETSGANVYAAVKGRWPKLAERFLFITGGVFSPEARRFLEEDHVACINKPFQVDELLDLIDRRAKART